MTSRTNILSCLLGALLLVCTPHAWAQQIPGDTHGNPSPQSSQMPSMMAAMEPAIEMPFVSAPVVPGPFPGLTKTVSGKQQSKAPPPANFGRQAISDRPSTDGSSPLHAELPTVVSAPVPAVTATPLMSGPVPTPVPAPVSMLAASASPQAEQVAQTTVQPSQNPAPPLASATVATQTTLPKKIELPVPIAPQQVPSTSDILILPLSKTKGVELGRTVRDVIIGNPDIADIVVRSQKQVYLIGKKIGDTNVFFVDANGELIHKVDIVVQPDAEGVQSNIDTLLSGEHIQAKGMGDSIVLTGTASSDGAAAQARTIARRFVAKDENVVSMIRVANEQQVLLRVRVAEAQKTVLKELGVDNLLSPTTLGPLTIDAATTALGLGPNIAGTLGLSAGNWDSNIRLLEQHGLLRTLAEPNLLAVSGETASMLAGGEYPIPVPQSQDTITIQYKPFGVSLAFLPVVMDSGRISLKISTEVSSLSTTNSISIPVRNGAIQVQSFTTRRANSTVELPSGGSLMIAGLMQNDIISSLNGVPGLMDIPILGTLFHSTSFQRNETELVILVSVVLAKPTDPKQLALPTDGFAPATDLDRYFLGNLQNIYSKKPAQGSDVPTSLQGPIGYIVK